MNVDTGSRVTDRAAVKDCAEIILTNGQGCGLRHRPCSESETSFFFRMAHWPSMFPVVEKAQQDPHDACNDTGPVDTQSKFKNANPHVIVLGAPLDNNVVMALWDPTVGRRVTGDHN